MDRTKHTQALRFGVVAGLTLLLATPPLRGQEQVSIWKPDAPATDEFDWVQLTSGEWLKGKLLELYDDVLKFDSDELDEVSLDWEDVKTLRSGGTVQVGLVGKVTVSGILRVEGEAVRILGDPEQRFDRSQLMSITPGGQKERNYWSGDFSVGANLRHGNTGQLETNAHILLRRRTALNRLETTYLANFGRLDETTIANNQRATLGWDRFVSDRFFLALVTGEYFRDPFQNIGHRGTIGAGAGYEIIDTSKVDWQLAVGLGYQRTAFDTVPQGEADSASTAALALSSQYDNEITAWVDLTIGYRFFLVNEESGRYTHHALAGLEIDLVGSLELDVTLVWDRIQRPRPDADGVLPRQDDLRLNLALGFDF